MSRGLRNNNPGNIRQSTVKYQGEISPSADPAFKQFKSIIWGYRAMFMLLHTYQKKHGLNSLKSMIERYAPPHENHTDGYLKAVCNWSGISAEQVLNTLDGTCMIPIVCAMSRVENGVQAIRGDAEAGWKLFIQTTEA
jgi:hypothetical protein